MSRSAGADRSVVLLGAAAVLLAALGAFAAAASAGEETPPAAPVLAAPPRGVQRPLAPASNPTTPEKVALGAKLFTDTRLSSNGKVSCSGCHVAALAFTDGLQTARGVTDKPLARNAPSLLNVALLPSLFWDGRVASLEEQARLPLLHPDEMGLADEDAVARVVSSVEEYPPLFEKAFGDRTITLQRVARALAAFERTLLAGDAPFDRWWAGDETAMDDAAKRGYRTFVDAGGCAQCHSIRQSHALFTDGDFHNTGAGKGAGLADEGRFAVTKRDEDRGAFRTPGLRNVALTAPYMHDGSLGTLEEVVDFYVEGGRQNPHLSPLMHPLALDERERADLVAFLKALTSSSLPALEECDRLLAEGRPAEAFEAFRRELDERGGGTAAVEGLARSALALGRRQELVEAERRVRLHLGEVSPERSRDGEEAPQRLLLLLARVDVALSQQEEAMALARRDDALIALRRIRTAAGLKDDAAALEAWVLESTGRAEEAMALLEPATSPALRVARAKVVYRRGWGGFSGGSPSERDRKDLSDAADALDAVPADALDDEAALFRATARHWLGDVERARTAYLAAAVRETAADRALRGLRNLLAKDLDRYRMDLAGVRAARPDSPTVLYLTGFELLDQGDLAGAEAALRRRLEVETAPAAGVHLLLARIERRRGNRTRSLSQYAVALATDPAVPGLAAEYEGLLRERKLDGFADVDAIVAEYRTFLDAGPDDPRFQALARNNLAFLLRDVAASYTSRGPARLHTFAEGAPPKAREVLRTALDLYEEAAALVPEDVADLPFSERWQWAGVLNDLGLMLHYFPEIQDLDRAERCYLRAFELTGGAYQDAYFYNLQFLYGFELDGRDELWLSLAERAKDAILREDPSSPSGFAPDEMKRKAARRDWERLGAKLRR